MNQPEKNDHSQTNENQVDVWQFSLANLLELTTYTSVFVWGYAAGAATGLFLSLAVFFACFFYRRKQFDLAVASVILWLLFGMLIPNVTITHSAERRLHCNNNLRQLNLALYHYESAHGQLPPAFTTDALRNKLHSW